MPWARAVAAIHRSWAPIISPLALQAGPDPGVGTCHRQRRGECLEGGQEMLDEGLVANAYGLFDGTVDAV